MTGITVIALLLSGGLLDPVSAPQGRVGQVSVFVGVPTRDGFLDASKPVLDSVKDIEKQIAQRPGLVFATDPAKADIRLWVVDRGVGSEAYGSRATLLPYFNGAVMYQRTAYANTYWVATILEVGSYRKEIVGAYTHGLRDSFGAWTEAAAEISREVETWANSNRAKLIELRPPSADAVLTPETAYSKLTTNEQIWRITLPATAAKLQLVDGARVRIVLSGRYEFEATLAQNGNTFTGTGVLAGCAKEAPRIILTDEAGGFTGQLEIYDCTSPTAGPSRVGFRVF